MSKLKVEQLETLDGSVTVDVPSLQASLSYANTIEELNALSPEAVPLVSVQGSVFKHTGSSWENLSRTWSPEMYSNLVVGDDWADALIASATAATGGTWRAGKTEYKTSKQITFDYGTHIDANGSCNIDGSLITDAANAPQNAVVLFGNSPISQIANLSATATKDTNTLTFATAHNLSVGDIICIYNPTDYSYRSFRSTYRAGEWCRITHVVSTTEVIVETPLYATYAPADVEVYKVEGGSFSFSGKFSASCSGSGVILSALYFFRCKDTDISGVKGVAITNNAGILIRECFNITGTGVTGVQSNLSEYGTDYGMSIANSQHLDITGYFKSSRHGVAHGGYSGPGAVVVRDSKIRGTIVTDNVGSTQAADWHGNCEYCLFDGNIIGGIAAGGQHNTVKGRITGDNRGICVYFRELAGHSFDFSGVSFHTIHDALALASRGTIDLGGNSTADATDTSSGVLDFSNCTIFAPASTRCFNFRARARTSNGQINLSGTYIHIADSTGTQVLIEALNADTSAWNIINLNNFKMFGSGTYKVSASRVVGEVTGEVALTTTDAAHQNTTVTWPFNFGVEPDVFVSTNKVYIGTQVPIATATSVTATDASIGYASADNTAFAAGTAITIRYTAKVDYYS